VRELENVVERAMIQSTGDTLRIDRTFGVPQRGTSKAVMPGEDRLDDVQRAHIASILDDCGWRINEKGNAAERLGIHPNTLRFRMNKLGITSPPGRGKGRKSAAGAAARSTSTPPLTVRTWSPPAVTGPDRRW
jgi:DNA-binding NtrC family response regulator